MILAPVAAAAAVEVGLGEDVGLVRALGVAGRVDQHHLQALPRRLSEGLAGSGIREVDGQQRACSSSDLADAPFEGVARGFVVVPANTGQAPPSPGAWAGPVGRLELAVPLHASAWVLPGESPGRRRGRSACRRRPAGAAVRRARGGKVGRRRRASSGRFVVDLPAGLGQGFEVGGADVHVRSGRCCRWPAGRGCPAAAWASTAPEDQRDGLRGGPGFRAARGAHGRVAFAGAASAGTSSAPCRAGTRRRRRR